MPTAAAAERAAIPSAGREAPPGTEQVLFGRITELFPFGDHPLQPHCHRARSPGAGDTGALGLNVSRGGHSRVAPQLCHPSR